MEHPKYQATSDAIHDLFCDKSVGPQTTLQALEKLYRKLETRIEAVKLETYQLTEHDTPTIAQAVDPQCCSQGDYELYESRISDLLEEADELESMIVSAKQTT